MVKNPSACGECHLVLAEGVEQCPHHPSSRVSSDWTGYAIIMQPQRAEIAMRLKVEQPGYYALKENIY